MNRLSKYFLTATLFAGTAQATPLPSTNATTTYHRVQVDGIWIFYREAGPENAPTIVLLHGFPSSSREFDTLVPLLATKYHLIAPDHPGFGLSNAPSPTAYTYTFDHVAQTMSDFLEELKVTQYTMYLHDYGAPIGFTVLMSLIDPHPALKAAVSMNPMVDGWRGDDWFHNGAFREEMMSYIYDQTASKLSNETWFTLRYDDYDASFLTISNH